MAQSKPNIGVSSIVIFIILQKREKLLWSLLWFIALLLCLAKFNPKGCPIVSSLAVTPPSLWTTSSSQKTKLNYYSIKPEEYIRTFPLELSKIALFASFCFIWLLPYGYHSAFVISTRLFPFAIPAPITVFGLSLILINVH